MSHTPKECIIIKKIEDHLDWSMMNFPINFNDIDKFEKKNNISINIIGLNDNGSYVPMRPTKIINAIKEIDLLLINDGEKWHYVVIKNLNRLLGSQCNNHK